MQPKIPFLSFFKIFTILSFLSLAFLFSCTKEVEIVPSEPSISILEKPELLPIFSQVAFKFKAEAPAGLKRISVKFLNQNAEVEKTTGFDTDKVHELLFSHPTGFESIGLTLVYEITVTDQLDRSSKSKIEIPVQQAIVNIIVSKNGNAIQEIKANEENNLTITGTSNASLFSIKVVKVKMNNEEEVIFYKSNIQMNAPNFIAKNYSTPFSITPEEGIKSYKFTVEDNARIINSIYNVSKTVEYEVK
jgi:hypothetical protein